MEVFLKTYATILILLWVAGLFCLLLGKLESRVYDIIANAMGMVIAIGFIGLIAFAVWTLWNL